MSGLRLEYWLLRIGGPSIIVFTHMFMLYVGTERVYSHCWGWLQEHVPRSVAILIATLILAPNAMIVLSLALTVLGDPGYTELSIERMLREGMVDESFFDQFAKCVKCGLPKPPRCHHCSTCNKCHLKMDHHCPAVGMCIALRNQRPFLVMLRWTLFTCQLNVLVCVFAWIVGEDRMFASLMVFTLLILVGAINFVWSDAIERVLVNMTTIEEMSGDNTRLYDLGQDQNWKQVFGSWTFGHFIPEKSKMTGFEWSNTMFQNPDVSVV